MDALGSAGTIVMIGALVLLVLAIFRIPVRIVFKLLINTAIGFAALLLLDWIGGLIGISVAINWINAAIVGVLGVPGVALILLLQWLAAL